MCGIAGFLSSGRAKDAAALISWAKRMGDAIRHRGPDGSGAWSDPSAGVSFAHCRLSIIDLSAAGAQPMGSESGRYTIIFNGEIYNHLDLRKAIEGSGTISWRGHSDTETILAAFERWGIERTLRQIVGMFAFALWDGAERRLYLARDRMGEKPLYYGWAGNDFAFASELGAFQALPGFEKQVNRFALSLYMQSCNVPAPYSIYHGVFKLPPGTFMVVSEGHVESRTLPKPESYWSVVDAYKNAPAAPDGDDAQIERLHELLRQSVRGQMLSDVPLGAFLSGGVDSSLIVSLMQEISSTPVKTFTIGFDETAFDESPYAAAVAKHLRTDHTEHRVSAKDALNVIPHLAAMYGEPFADSSQIPTHLVCKAARQHVTVALSGDAGDELFGGYQRYLWCRKIWSVVGPVPYAARRAMGAAMQAMPLTLLDMFRGIGPVNGDRIHRLGAKLARAETFEDLYRGLMTEWPLEMGLVIGEKSASGQYYDYADGPHPGQNATERMMTRDMVTYLPDDILTKVDRAAMAVSLETRVPMLDHRVVEYALSLPVGAKIRAGQGKWILRQVLYRYVPQSLIERPKTGFALPLAAWLRGDLRDWAEALLNEELIRKQGYLNPALVRTQWEQHISGRRDWTARLWAVLMFQSWLEHQRKCPAYPQENRRRG